MISINTIDIILMSKHHKGGKKPGTTSHRAVFENDLLKKYIGSFDTPIPEFTFDIIITLSNKIYGDSVYDQPWTYWLTYDEIHQDPASPRIWWWEQACSGIPTNVILEHQGYRGETVQYAGIALDYGDGTDEKYQHAIKLTGRIRDALDGDGYYQDTVELDDGRIDPFLGTDNWRRDMGLSQLFASPNVRWYEAGKNRADQIKKENVHGGYPMRMDPRVMKNLASTLEAMKVELPYKRRTEHYDGPRYALRPKKGVHSSYGCWRFNEGKFEGKFFINGLTRIDQGYKQSATSLWNNITRLRQLRDSLKNKLNRGKRVLQHVSTVERNELLRKDNDTLATHTEQLQKYEKDLTTLWKTREKIRVVAKRQLQRYADEYDAMDGYIRLLDDEWRWKGFLSMEESKGEIAHDIESVEPLVELVTRMLDTTVKGTVSTTVGEVVSTTQTFAEKMHITNIERIDSADNVRIRCTVGPSAVDLRVPAWKSVTSDLKF